MTDRLTDEAARAIITLGTGPGACAGAARALALAEGPIRGRCNPRSLNQRKRLYVRRRRAHRPCPHCRRGSWSTAAPTMT
jgi:hypothetical protein